MLVESVKNQATIKKRLPSQEIDNSKVANIQRSVTSPGKLSKIMFVFSILTILFKKIDLTITRKVNK